MGGNILPVLTSSFQLSFKGWNDSFHSKGSYSSLALGPHISHLGFIWGGFRTSHLGFTCGEGVHDDVDHDDDTVIYIYIIIYVCCC